MFKVMNESELMSISGGNWAVPYYPCQEDFKKKKPRGYTWTGTPGCAYVIWLAEFRSDGSFIREYSPQP